MKPTNSPPPLLFSIDLEEFYPAKPDCNPRSSQLTELIGHYLDLLQQHNIRGTFFVVGEVARRFPSLLRTIVTAGHELGCHGDRHITIDQFTPATFAADLRANRAAVEAAAGIRVQGFRAPLLSLTAKTAWAHAVLASEGFSYSSSVLPAPSPLYGWPDFGPAPRRVEGVWEIPVTIAPIPGIGPLPLYGGSYFRVLPWWLVRHRLQSLPTSRPLVSYFHPYDIDHRQPWTMHEGVRGNRAMNSLLFLRRKSLLGRIAKLIKACPTGLTYGEYVDHLCVSP